MYLHARGYEGGGGSVLRVPTLGFRFNGPCLIDGALELIQERALLG
jgi:hypothetical protein